MNYPVFRNWRLRARARVLAWQSRATRLRSCRHADSAMAWASGWRGAATASTACNSRRVSGSVIPASLFFSQPPPLQHQEPQGQHHQRLVVVPATPALDLVVPQPQFVLAPQETVLDRPTRVADPHHGPQRTVRGRVAQVVLQARLLRAATL